MGDVFNRQLLMEDVQFPVTIPVHGYTLVVDEVNEVDESSEPYSFFTLSAAVPGVSGKLYLSEFDGFGAMSVFLRVMGVIL